MKELLIHLKENIPFYRDIIPDDVYEIQSEDCIKEMFEILPIVDKNTIKDNFDSFLSSELMGDNIEDILDCNKNFARDYEYNINGKKYWVEYTSGTTGRPMPMIKSFSERMKLGNSVWKMRRKVDNVKPRQMFGFMHNVDGQYPFPFPFIVDREQRKKKELEFLNTSDYTWWHIFPAQLESYCEFVQYYDKNNSNLKVIECNGAYVSEEEIKKYEDTFGCMVSNNYGCREVWNVAYSCKNGELHINEENVYLEIVDDNNQVITEPDIVGDIVVTSKYLRKMPIVRYRIGDCACYKSITCDCGDESRIIQIRPQRNMIIGTNRYGNDVFRSVLINIFNMYGMKKFEAINVMQEEENSFIINIKKCEEDKMILEKRFIECTNQLLETDKYNYTFTYLDDLNFKSIFVVKK